MKPAAFEYRRADSVTAAVDALASPEARVIAGGQSLVPLMNLRLAQPATLVDVNGLIELDDVRVENGHVVLGALCRHRRVELDPVVRDRAPLLAEATALIGHPAIRNRGTIGGNLAHGDPAAELGAALVALGGRVRVRGSSGEREIGADALFTGFFTTSLAEDELLVNVVVPGRGERDGSAFVEFAPRHGDFAVVGIAARVVLDPDGRCAVARAGACGVAATPVDLSAALEQVVGADGLTDERLVEVVSRVPSLFDALSDLQASEQDRYELAQLLTVEALRRAWARAQGTS